mgnify:CR=1 FL=1
MNYPLSKLDCSGGEGYNIVFLVVDALRFDMITEQTMPNVAAFSKNAMKILRTITLEALTLDTGSSRYLLEFQVHIGTAPKRQNRALL